MSENLKIGGVFSMFPFGVIMDKDKKDQLENALRDQRPHERYNQALARTMSAEEQGEEAYKKYLDLIDQVRDKSTEEDCSIEEAVKILIGKK